jgi:polyisoprenyl-teichoic acid--peptidoglycan teichoic acid transferase
MPIIKRLILAFLALLPLTCYIPGRINMSPPETENTVVANNPIFLTPGPDATLTATPFLPVPPTPTYFPTDFPTPLPTATSLPDTPTPGPTVTLKPVRSWGSFPGPTVWPDIELPPPVGLLHQPSGQYHIVLLGSDQRPNTSGFRTDAIMLVTLNPQAGTANITSIPRDLYVYIPGWTVQRINTALPWGGFRTLSMTFEYNLGVRPDYYVLINFWSFVEVIDSLGGIDVKVARTHTDQRSGHGQYTVEAGTVNMDGETALWYVRSRYSTSDYDRGRRQQEVLLALFNRMISLNAVTRAPELYDIYKQNVTTNMTFEDITPLLSLAPQLTDSSKIREFSIGANQVTNWRNTTGAAVLLPNREAVLRVMRQAVNSP